MRDAQLLAERNRIWEVPAFWEDCLQNLPPDDEFVTEDEVANALLTWLEDAVKDEDP